jgi:hypothetical protein
MRILCASSSSLAMQAEYSKLNLANEEFIEFKK